MFVVAKIVRRNGLANEILEINCWAEVEPLRGTGTAIVCRYDV